MENKKINKNSNKQEVNKNIKLKKNISNKTNNRNINKNKNTNKKQEVNKNIRESTSNKTNNRNIRENKNKSSFGKNYKDNNLSQFPKLRLMALGGLGEVGKNCYLVEYGKDIFVIDYGVLFPDRDQLGIDYIIPNYTYLKENQHRIVGLFITHGHEDHIGGIPFLLKKLKIKNIYAPLTAKFMIEKKLKEHKINQSITLLTENDSLKFGKVIFHTFHQTHSIPDSLGFFIETPIGNVATTGDFKVDFSPPGEKRTDFHKIVDLSRKGVLCLMSDSTNSMREGFSSSAQEVGDNLKILMSEAKKGLILYTTFASHINRIEKIVEGAKENNRKICVLGRSMKNNLAIGMKTGYIKLKKSDIIDPKDVNNYPREKICILSTGSQGETLAALSRIAHGLNPYIELSEDDTVVFASNPIPGNSYQIGKVIDQLYTTGCKIVANTEYFKTHTSGHASKEEEKLMLSLFDPKYFMPIHGTYNMQLNHKNTAVKIGMDEKNIFLVNNGDSLVFSKGKKPYIERKRTHGYSMMVAGNNINISLQDSNIDRLASDGILIMTALIKKNKDLACYPQVTTRGFVIINESIEMLKGIQQYFVKLYKQNYKNLNEEDLEDLLIDKISECILKKMQKMPMIRINLIDYNPQK